MKAFLTTAAAIALAVSPASAQLLGGSGAGSLGGALGGGIGGAMGGGFGGTLGGDLGSTGSRIGDTTRGTMDGAARTSGEQSVNRRSGRITADRAVTGSAGGAIDQTTDTPRRAVDTSASGKGSGSANVGGEAQLIGTDGVRETARETRSAVGTARGTTSEIAGSTRAAAGSGLATARGTAQASTANAISATNNQLAIAGSAAADAAGAIAIKPGMAVQSAKGRTIGTVRNAVADSNGKVRSVVVEANDRLATLPAGNFSGSGDVLVSGMTAGEIKKVSKAQAKDADKPNG